MAQGGPFVYWMGQDSFFVFDGANVQALRCTVWDFVYDNLDRNYTDAIFCAVNSYFNEVAWYFPTIGSNGVVTSYVKFNMLDSVWDYGTLGRSAWIDQSIFGAPVGADYNMLLQQHEVANDLDGLPMDSWAQSGEIEMGDGSMYLYLDRLLPDFLFNSPSDVAMLTVYVSNFLGDTPRVYGPYQVTSSSKYLVVHARGRYASLKVESNGLGSFWRLGKTQAVVSPAGRR
jgi:hypothetical protein